MALSVSNSLEFEFDEGVARLAAGEWAAAVALLRRAVRREPSRLAAVRALATACLRADEVDEGRAALAEFTMDHPMCAEGWRLAAQYEWKTAQYGAAMEILARGLEHLPHSKILHRQTALFWGARGKLETSARHAARAADAGPVDAYVAAARGTGPGDGALFQTPLPAAAAVAADWFDRVAQDPRLLETLLNLPGDEGDVEILRGLENKLAALLESQPYHADRQLGLARLQVKLEMWSAAMGSVQRALRANPRYVEAKRLRATILGKVGEFDRAIEAIEDLIAGGLDYPDLHLQVAEMQRARGRADEARGHLYSAIRLNPGFERAREMLERLAA
jgi:tetratricopeptide (TPR) repeat protein